MTRPTLATPALLTHRRKHTAPTVVWPAEWWTDSLETGDNWTYTGTGGDDTHGPDAAACRAGTLGLLLKTRVTGAANGDILTAKQLLSLPTEDYVALTFYARLPSKTPSYGVYCALALLTGGREYHASIGHVTSSNKWIYTNSAGVDTDIPAGGYVWPANTWVQIIVRVRTSTLRFQTCTLAGTDYDLSAQAMRDTAAAASTGAAAIAVAVANASAPITVHYDTYLMTHSPTP